VKAPVGLFVAWFLTSATAGARGADGPPMDLIAAIDPPSGEICASPAGSSEKARCGPCTSGVCRLELPDGWKNADLSVEAKARNHFPETRVGRVGERMTFRLVALPSVDWRGWSRAAAVSADIDWLPADRSDEWRRLGKAVAPGVIFLPGETRAIRFSSAARGSPKTLFASGARAAFGVAGPLPVKPGAEVALCLEVRDRRRPPPVVALRVVDSAGKEHPVQTNAGGCAALDGIPPGLVTIAAESSARYRFEPIHTRIRGGEGLWLGTVPVEGPASLIVQVEDADPTHVFALAIESSNPLEPHRIRERGRITPGTPLSRELPAAEYRVSLRPEFADSSDLTEIVSLKSSEERTISFQPRFYRVSGIASRGDTPLGQTPLLFSREETSGLEMTLRLTTQQDGSYAGWFGQPGKWHVVAGEESGFGGARRPVRIVLPDAPVSTVDVRFPGGAIAGIVVDAKTGKPKGPVPLYARAHETDGDREFSMTMTSDDEGRFRLEALPECRVSIGVLDAVASAMRVRSGARVVVDVPGDGEATAELRLEPVEEGTRLRVVDRNGLPIMDAQAHRGDTGPVGALLGRSDDRGEVSLPGDLPPGTPIYVIAAAHPWAKTSAPSESDSPRTVSLEDPRREPAILRFEPAEGSAPAELFFGLTDSAGNEVPVFFHMIRQGAMPTARAGVATIPQAGDGAYVVWVRGARGLHPLGTVVFPSAAPLVVPLGPCGSDCAGR
jgi:hypothetical protein